MDLSFMTTGKFNVRNKTTFPLANPGMKLIVCKKYVIMLVNYLKKLT